MRKLLSKTGAGFMVAATGIGAGDMIAASVAGSRFGVLILWAVLLGGLIKFALNEGLARWQLATGSTLIEGWLRKLPKVVSGYFLLYLFFWGFLVAGTLISFCGLVAHAIFPLGSLSDKASIAIWGALHSLVAVGLLHRGGYQLIENIMKLFVGGMFLVVLISAVMVCPDWSEVLISLVLPRIPDDLQSITFILALMGGVGGSVTILCYAYWLRESRGAEPLSLFDIRFDLGLAYLLTVLFGLAVVVVSAGVNPDVVKGYGMIQGIADKLSEPLGSVGKWSFLIGFWGAVFSSMLGVWNGIPYLFADFRRHYQGGTVASEPISIRSGSYRFFLYYLAFPPILLCLFEKPVWIGIAYSVAGAFFMPFLAAVLLYMNNQRGWMGIHRNHWLVNLLLVGALVLFLLLFLQKVVG
ncbi:MAG: Nramp family divalent metal transporter [Bacteroidota bacterium]